MAVDHRQKGPQLPECNHRALVLPETVNDDERTVDIVFASDEPVRRRNWQGSYFEVLSMAPENVIMRRLQNGAPLLDNHHRFGSVADDQIGVVTDARLDGNRGIATVKFSDKEKADVIFQDIKNGIIRNFSVGYIVYVYQHTENENGPDEYRALEWEPIEISVVPIPFDPNAQVRGIDGKMQFRENVQIISKQNSLPMAERTANNGDTPQSGGDQGQRGLAPDNQQVDPVIIQTRTQEQPPADPPAPNVQTRGQENTPPVVADQSAIDAAVARAMQQQQQLHVDIRAAVSQAMLPESFALDLIGRGVDINEARRLIIAEWSNEDNTQIRSINTASLTGEGEQEKVNNAIGYAIELRCDPNAEVPEEYTQLVRQWRHLDLVGMARQYLGGLGRDVSGNTPREISSFALQGRAYHSTSDFPIILGNTINRRLARAYTEVPRTFTPFCRRSSLRDFRPITVARLSELLGPLQVIPEGGEYKSASFTESGETYQLAKFGRIINFTWESMINDDLGAFNRIPAAIAAKAANKQSDLVWNILIGNPNMGDGVALFHASHGNLAASGTDIDVTNLAAARAAMRKQKNVGGEDFINVQPSFLMVGPDKELVANQYTSTQFVANESQTINPRFNTSLDVIVEPRLLGNQWYLSASPGQVDTIEYAFLDGESEIFTEQRDGFDVDGIHIKVRMVFATKAIDWRGLYKNPGA